MSEGKTDLNQNRTEEEIVDAVAEALRGLGLCASSQDTGGGINCVVLQHKDGGEIVWGTADITWGAAINNADGDYVSSISTSCPSDTQDIASIAQALLEPSIKNGGVRAK